MVKKKNYKKYSTLFSGESNPFNIKMNRKKHAVLGSGIKGTKGLPAISKGLNYAKRKEFLKKNKVAAQKSNTYIDKRTKNPNVLLEDQVTAKFVRERQKKSIKSVFNLSGDRESNHEAKQDLISSDEDENNTLRVSFKNKSGQISKSNFEAPKSHKEIIEEIISDSKQKKMERKMEKEKYLNSLEQVDNAWKEIHFSSSKTYPSKNTSKILSKEPVESNTKDLYDVSKNELKFETKCSSISHNKSIAEIEKEEQRKHTQLEKEKLHRMNDNYELNNFKTYNHISADAICDEYEYLQPIAAEDKCELSEENNESDEASEESQSSDEEMNQDENVLESEDESFEQDDFLPDIPSDINDFKIRVKDCDAEKLTAVLDNILRKYVRSKNEKVLIKLENFFEILLRFAFECCEKKFPKLELISALPPHLHSLANAVNLGTAYRFLKFLDEEHQIFTAYKKRSMKKNFPRPQTIIILKYAALIYSTSDFRHHVVTPAMIFMCDILASTFCITLTNILSRLLISELVLNCIADSQRFVPEAVHFLNNILQLAAPAKLKRKNKFFDLVITNKVSTEDIPTLDLFTSNKDLSDESKKIGVIFTVTAQLFQFATLYNRLPSFKEIFEPTLIICDQLPVHFYPVLLESQIKQLVELGQQSVSLNQLSFQKAKPKPLKMFEPVFESKFNQKDEINKKRKLIKKVAQKIKKEEKSMLREIRRDAQVAASEKLREKLELDADRKRKVKEIYGSLSVQEGEFKKMMKKKS